MPLISRPYVCVLERESLETVDPQREKWAFSKSRKNRREEKQEPRHARKLIRLSSAVVPRGRNVEREKFKGPKVSCCLFLGKTNTNSLNISRRPTLDYAQTKSTVCRKKNCLVHTMLPLIGRTPLLFPQQSQPFCGRALPTQATWLYNSEKSGKMAFPC